MKKSLLFCLLIITALALTTLILAEDANIAQVKEVSGTIGSESTDNQNSENLKDFSNDLLSKQIIIPDNLQSISRLVFGVTENLTLQDFIILTVLWIFLVLILQAILTIVPMFGDDWKSWIGAVIITLLISITGTLKQIKDVWFSFEWLTKLLHDWGLFNLILIILMLIVFAFGARKLIHMMKHKAAVEGNEIAGMRSTAGIP